MTIAGAILAGGGATRLGGAAKGLIPFGESRAIDRVAAALREAGAGRVLVAASAPDAHGWLPGAEVVRDSAPGAGPLGAIVDVLRRTLATTIVVAWDMPRVSARLLRPLLAAAMGHDAAMYRHAGGIEPLCAVYQPAALEPLAAAFDAGERSPSRAAARLRVAFVSGDDEIVGALASVNDPDELRRATLDLTPTQATATDA